MGPAHVVGAAVVDGTGRDPRKLDISVEKGRITRLGASSAHGERLDAGGLTMTPGLIDAHVHLGLSSPIRTHFSFGMSAAEIAADIFATAGAALDAGFTTVRDTGGIDGGVVTAIARGKVRGPRVLSCGPVQCQIGGHGYYGAEWEPTELWSSHHIPGLCALSMMAGNADELRHNVREAFRRGASFLKLCVTGGVVGAHDRLTDTQFTVEEITVAVQEAAARNTYVTVHAHNNDGIRNAVEAGVRCVEHGTSLDESTAALMAAREVALVPTFAVIEQLLRDTAGAGLAESTRDRVEGARERMTTALAVAKHAGVRVGLGSDLIGPAQERRGEELSLRAALETPMEALVAATRTNAGILGLSGRVGVIAPGAQADLVLWNGDPLEDPELFSDPTNAVLVIQAGQIVKDLR
ncbi:MULTISPECIES: metal-dependent hydrolase family protein [Streptomyces]|jgi:imidazolonepropionase-like amidohydrolase|uniref:Imidazolonepropionase-like amidohydrolase n=2 Tax=Streptomyces TaxID=1883 RepID=A0ABT9L8K0_STRGD|nr:MULTISPECIES: amidohydrolase family protein [Streptomyces]MDP9680036.1 imidazolonepropionase-like amidohydrolase [Streptomyces griseoviridis]GGT05076.1 peptidase M38 [Streptomyces griseoviridis]GGU69297.1 peptidase M38 [Streptomyces daghestanicus]GHI29457.1 peptidase M38 [Streptomyces daghestanicus]